MESLTYNFGLGEARQPFTSSNEVSSTTEPGSPSAMSGSQADAFTAGSSFQPNAASFQPSNDLLSLLAQQEPRPNDSIPSATELDDMMMNFRLGGSEINFDDIDANQNYFMGSGNRSESVTSRNSLWNDGSGASSSARQTDQMATFDFLVKSVSAANNYVSMLTREQLTVLQSLRPSLLYEFLQEVAKVRNDKRSRRALPNECAFCKNNGENEECYSSHSLKDWRGRVLCPVLRAFRCPRCGATGDRAHTIKYCPDNNDASNERGGLSSRRRMPSSLSPIGGSTMPTPLGPLTPPGHAPPPPSPQHHTPMSHNSLWSSFGMN